MKITFTIPGQKDSYSFSHPGSQPPSAQQKKHFRLQIARHLPSHLLPLHATLLNRNELTIAICGASQSGKSTLAKLLVTQGFTIHANDFIAVWENNQQLLAADINYETENRTKKPLNVKHFIFLNPEDPRDIFTENLPYLINLYSHTLPELKVSLSLKNNSVFNQIYKHHLVLGNRQSPTRWFNLLDSHLLNPSPPTGRIGVIGLGSLGQHLTSLLVNQPDITQLNLYSLNQDKLNSFILDLKSANPNQIIHQQKSLENVFTHSDIVILTFRISNPTQASSTSNIRFQKLFDHVQALWPITRAIRATQYQGRILVVTNPVDPLSWSTYYLSNLNNSLKPDWTGLSSSQVIGVGLGLDHRRLQTLTNQPLEIIGEHGDNLLLAQYQNPSILKPYSNQTLLSQVLSYSDKIRQHLPRTITGPAHETISLITHLLNSKHTPLRASSLNQQGVFLGNILTYHSGILGPSLIKSSSLQKLEEPVVLLHKQFQQKIIQNIKKGAKLKEK